MNDISPETVLAHIRSGSDAVAEHFDKIYGQTVDIFGGEIAYGLESLRDEIFNKSDDLKLSQADMQSAFAFWSSLNTLIASIELMRRGYWKEPGALHRSALEMASTAYDLRANPSKLESFLKGEFDSAKSITVAKQVHPLIGRMYGGLSNVFSHSNVANARPHGLSVKDEVMKLWIGGGFKESDIKTHMLIIPPTGQIILIVNMLAEISFQGLMKPRLWERHGDFLKFMPPIKMREELKKYTPLLEEIINS